MCNSHYWAFQILGQWRFMVNLLYTIRIGRSTEVGSSERLVRFSGINYIPLFWQGQAKEGHDSDGSSIGQVIEYNKISIPSGAALPSTKKVMPFVFVGDEAFPLKKLPFPGNTLPKERRIFNYRLSRAGRCVENAFSIMATRSRIFRKPITTSVETC
ncbi:DDE Tnp4 domain-containing protein [Caerostris extrusa]|uniref:DDE Tnp4 domain-containing protein n=1 Tax=Caerostris extrusa TaxID=172846 RepID=A0AAV4SI41_CAEEX|nr:DDE Tnp4 domain-containing protein [Caerostris extrusa]